jgi:hypothetical protein
MPGSTSSGSWLILHDAIHELVTNVRRDRALLPARSAERDFLLGVEAAAEDVLHPERADARPEHWLEREAPAFRDGFLRGAIVLSNAATAAEPPLVLRPPAFDPGRP